MNSRFVFVREDASQPSLNSLYCGSYLVVERWSKFFRLQIDQNWLPIRRPPETFILWLPGNSSCSSALRTTLSKEKKSLKFLTQPDVILGQTPYRQVRERRSCSALIPPYLLCGSSLVEDDPKIGNNWTRQWYSCWNTMIYFPRFILYSFLKLVNKIKALSFVLLSVFPINCDPIHCPQSKSNYPCNYILLKNNTILSSHSNSCFL